MDGKRFDDLAVRFGTSSRRGALRLLAGGALGAVLTALGLGLAPDEVAAACGDTGAKCKKGADCCATRCKKKRGQKVGKCLPCTAETCPNGCCDGATCRTGDSDAACGIGGESCVACPSGELCRNGVCGPDPDYCDAAADCDRFPYGLSCNFATNRCQCRTAGHGRCAAPNQYACGPCCPGGNGVCRGDTQCLSETEGGCQCAFGMTQCRSDYRCKFIESDPEACGPDCTVCGPGGSCCNGRCVDLQGCQSGTGGSVCTGSPCGRCDVTCPSGRYCCNGVCVTPNGVGCP